MTEAEKRNIDNLKSRVRDLERQLREAKERLIEAEMAATEFQPGDIVVNARGERRKVTGHRERYGSVQTLGVKAKPNGEWRKGPATALWDYERWQKVDTTSQPTAAVG